MPTEFSPEHFTFGVELECYLPEGMVPASCAAAVQARLGSPVSFVGYTHAVSSNWKIVTDGSLGDMSRGIELVSPILRGAAGLEQVEKVCRALTDFGCTVSKKCGYHVHVGAGSPEIGFFRRLVNLYAGYEPVIDSVMPPSRRASNNSFCRSITNASAQSVNACGSLQQLINTLGSGRYAKVNLNAYARHRTVEFRQHSGTLDAAKARSWAVLCMRMVHAAREGVTVGGTATAPLNTARPGSKAHAIGQMMLRPEGVTAQEVCSAMNWPSVSLPQQARICGIQFTTRRTGRLVRYFAVQSAPTAPAHQITIDGFCDLIGADAADRQYLHQRRTDLSGPVQWAA